MKRNDLKYNLKNECYHRINKKYFLNTRIYYFIFNKLVLQLIENFLLQHKMLLKVMFSNQCLKFIFTMKYFKTK
jgi:hypothetical protein